MKVYRTIIQTTLFTLLSVGCASILGIEDAELAEDADGGASGSAGNGGSTSNGGSGGSGNAQTPCEQYCDTVMNNCTAEFGVYTSEAVCLSLCETMPEGDPENPKGDTVACRLDQAEKAAITQEPGDHCPVAGLGGADVCGENCPAFCRAMLEFCPDEYDSDEACLTDCESLDDLGGFDLSQDSGATVQCRIWHVGAATQATLPHCAHAAGADPCIAE